MMKTLIATFGNPLHYASRLFYSLLKGKGGVKLFFFGGYWDKNTERFLADYLLSEKPDLIAISVLTFELELCRKLVAAVRRLRTQDETKIIFGGPHAFLDPESCLSIADFVCTGEGEYTILGLKEEFDKTESWGNVSLEKIPNLMYRSEGAGRESGVQDFLYTRPSIDGLPFPAYGEDGIYVYNGVAWQGDMATKGDFYYAFASRGCPNRCSYCINAVYKTRKVNFRLPHKVVEELVLAKKRFRALKRIVFVDSIFCWERKWVMEFARLYHREIGLPFEFSSFPGQHSEEVVRLLRQAGLDRVNIGLQSCSERVLNEVFGRRQDVRKIIPDNRMYIANGVTTAYDFIVDNPFETWSDLLETVEVARRLDRPNSSQIYSLYFFPHYLLTKRAEEEGLLKKGCEDSNFYHKITATHAGDQYSKKTWYTNPKKAIFGSDRKSALNWFLTCYGDPNIPKGITDFAFKKYKSGNSLLILALAYFYKFLDAFYYKTKNRFYYVARICRLYGPLGASRHIGQKVLNKVVSKTKGA